MFRFACSGMISPVPWGVAPASTVEAGRDGYSSRGLKGKPPEQDDSAYMRGWWKASARHTSRGYHTS